MARNPRFKKFYEVVKRLKEEFPVDLPIVVRRKSLKDYFGYCYKSNKKQCYFIVIDKGLQEEIAILTLCHEIAHLKSWNQQDIHHGQAWGKMYSKIYKYYEKNYLT